MKILLIGGSGQDAYYLSKFLTSKGAFVYWIYRGDVSKYQFNIDPSKVVYCNVSSYEFCNVYPLVCRESFDAVVLVVGAVGNQMAKANPLDAYFTNLTILRDTISLINSLIGSPHLYFFSTCDIDGNAKSNEPFLFSSNSVVMPSSTYGLSKKHCNELLRIMNIGGHLSSTVIHLAMHESFYRSGNYVLTKIKHAVSNFSSGSVLEPLEFGNLNVYIDIGFAAEFMRIVGCAILNKVTYPELTIGTGVYTHLESLCVSILESYGIPANDYLVCDKSKNIPLYYPLTPTSCLHHLGECDESGISVSPPLPLTAEMLKSERQDFSNL